jgi:nucleotide-binding universal stress UspA family protein
MTLDDPHSGLKSAVLGSVSREVVNAYHRPVVVV